MDFRAVGSIGDKMGEDLSQIFVNFSKQTYQTSCSVFQKPALESTCDDKVVRIYDYIIKNAILLSSKCKFQYRVWNEYGKIYILSYRKEDKIGSVIEKEILLEISQKIKQYLLEISSNWVPNNSELALSLKEPLKGYAGFDDLVVFEHDGIGDIPELFANIVNYVKMSSWRFDCTILKGKTLVVCSMEQMNVVTEIIKSIAIKFNWK